MSASGTDLPIENMVYTHQQEYYEAIAASTKAGESGPFIDFMLNEILISLKSYIKKEEVPDKVPNKVPNNLPNNLPNKSQILILDLLSQNPRLPVCSLLISPDCRKKA